jgi:hypothetical protein
MPAMPTGCGRFSSKPRPAGTHLRGRYDPHQFRDSAGLGVWSGHTSVPWPKAASCGWSSPPAPWFGAFSPSLARPPHPQLHRPGPSPGTRTGTGCRSPATAPATAPQARDAHPHRPAAAQPRREHQPGLTLTGQVPGSCRGRCHTDGQSVTARSKGVGPRPVPHLPAALHRAETATCPDGPAVQAASAGDSRIASTRR